MIRAGLHSSSYKVPDLILVVVKKPAHTQERDGEAL